MITNLRLSLARKLVGKHPFAANIHITGPRTAPTIFTMGSDEYDRLNPPWHDNEIQPHEYDDDWMPIGSVPRPTTRLGWFMLHFVHGLAMRYRFLPVLVFSFHCAFLEVPPGMEKNK